MIAAIIGLRDADDAGEEQLRDRHVGRHAEHHESELAALAHQGRLDPVVGRAREMDEVLDVLGKRRTNNPCLVGEPGVGKTAVVEGVAQRLLYAGIALALLPATLDARDKAAAERAIADAFVMGFRAIMLVSAALALAGTTSAWLTLRTAPATPGGRTTLT